MDQPWKAQARVVLYREEVEEIERLARAATQEEWKVGHTGTATLDEAVKWMEETIRKREEGDLWLAFIGDPDAEDGAITPAYTGNGPTSRANAEYIVAVQPNIVRKLLMFLRHQLGDQNAIDIPLIREE